MNNETSNDNLDPAPNPEPRGWYDNDGRLRGSEQPMEGKCAAHLRGTDPPRYCTRPINNCRHHKNKRTAKGISHPNYQGKWYSKLFKFMPKDLKKKCQIVGEDPEWISLQNSIQVLIAREAQIYERMEKFPPVPWGNLNMLGKKLDKAKSVAERIRLVTELREMIEQGANMAAVQRSCWAELREVFQEKAKLIVAESKRLGELQAQMPGEQVILLIRAILETVKVVVEAQLGKENARPILTEVMDKTVQMLPPS